MILLLIIALITLCVMFGPFGGTVIFAILLIPLTLIALAARA